VLNGEKMARRTLLITYIATYLLAVGGIIRTLAWFYDDRLLSIALLVGGYLVLLFSEPFFIRRNRLFTYIYFFVQIAIICTLSLFTPNVDFWAALFCPLVVQVMHNFPQRTGFLITGIFTVTMAIFMLLGLGPEQGLLLIFVYGVVYSLLAAFIAIIREAEASNEELRRQQLKLQAAHRQLQSYTTQAEELAVLQERNRLARELHDSVTQTIFSITLTAESARILLDRDPAKVAAQLDRLQELAKDALAEARSLIYHLRPQTVAEEGLIPALRRQIDERQDRDGLTVALHLEGVEEAETRLPSETEEGLFRIAQEALNNVAKHAQTDQAEVTLRLTDESVSLLIEDHGVGFDPDAVGRQTTHLGLTSMRQRARVMGATFAMKSEPGSGTSIWVEKRMQEA
jgi:signal transduction histidine kinase